MVNLWHFIFDSISTVSKIIDIIITTSHLLHFYYHNFIYIYILNIGVDSQQPSNEEKETRVLKREWEKEKEREVKQQIATL